MRSSLSSSLFQRWSRSSRIKTNSSESWGSFLLRFDCLVFLGESQSDRFFLPNHPFAWFSPKSHGEKDKQLTLLTSIPRALSSPTERDKHYFSASPYLSVTCPIVSCSFPRMKTIITTTTIIVNVRERSIFIKNSPTRSSYAFEWSSSLPFDCSLHVESMLGVDYTRAKSNVSNESFSSFPSTTIACLTEREIRCWWWWRVDNWHEIGVRVWCLVTDVLDWTQCCTGKSKRRRKKK